MESLLQTPNLLPLPEWPGVSLRHASEADYPVIAELVTAVLGQPFDLDLLRRTDSFRKPGEAFLRVLAERGGEAVALAEVSVPRSENYPGWLYVEVSARPEEYAGDAALPGALLDFVEASARDFGGTVLLTRTREGLPAQSFLEARGYAEHDRMWTSTLDLTRLDFARFEAQERRARASGVHIASLAELGGVDSEPQQRRLYDLIAALLRDVPSAAPIKVWPFELWQERYLPNLKTPAGLMLAVAPDGAWVGLSELHLTIPARPGTLHNGLTGVLPAWRGHGLGLALKLAAARAALARGFTHSRTSNHSVNRPMLAINEALGFTREAATVTLRKGG